MTIEVSNGSQVSDLKEGELIEGRLMNRLLLAKSLPDGEGFEARLRPTGLLVIFALFGEHVQKIKPGTTVVMDSGVMLKAK